MQSAVRRACELEILESGNLPQHVVASVHGELTRLHRVLGDTSAVLSALARDPLPIGRVLDVGCGAGGMMREVRQRLGVEVVGVDVSPAETAAGGLTIVKADAVREALPEADVAYCMHVGHHLSPGDLGRLIRNVGRSCRRLLLVDLVRHPLPFALFALFVAPFLSRVSASDGRLSVRRAYTPGELRSIVENALAGSEARFRHYVGRLYIRQVVDISYPRQDAPRFRGVRTSKTQ